jgi:murein DD-endopeptidase MepM/ murein hydrolase activator NlpD
MLKRNPTTLIVLISLIISFTFSCSPKKKKPESSKERYVYTYRDTLFGIDITDYHIQKNSINPGEHLSGILVSNGIDPQLAHDIAVKSIKVFSPMKLKAGNTYSFLKRKSDTNHIDYMIYEINNRSYLIYDFIKHIVYRHERKISTSFKSTSGVITSSLWNAMKDSGSNPELILTLSDIFAWVIDFYGLQMGDQFKVLYTELNADDDFIGIGEIHAAWFEHNGKSFYAFNWVTDSINDYFDEQGNSLRREFLKAPLQFRRISSHFSHNRFHPILRRYRPHHGVDYAAASGTPVVSIGDGKVTFSGRKGGAGNMVKIRHNSVYTTTYMHLRSYGEGIRQGATVKQGQVIGFVGSTGLSTGPHLDFRVQKNGQYINPLTLESPPAEPIPEHQKEDYLRTIAPWRSALDNIGNISNNAKQYLITRLPIASFSQQHIIEPTSNNGP